MVLTLVYDEKGNPIGQRLVQAGPGHQQGQYHQQQQEVPPPFVYSQQGPAYQDHNFPEDPFVDHVRRQFHRQPAQDPQHSDRAADPPPQFHHRQLQPTPCSHQLLGQNLDGSVVSVRKAPVYAPSLRHTQQPQGTSTTSKPEMAKSTVSASKLHRQVVKAGADPPQAKSSTAQDDSTATLAVPPSPYVAVQDHDTVNTTLADAQNLLALSQGHLQSAEGADTNPYGQHLQIQDALALVRSGHATPLTELAHGDEARETFHSSEHLAGEQRKLINERRVELERRQAAQMQQRTAEEVTAIPTTENPAEEGQNAPHHSVQPSVLQHGTAQAVDPKQVQATQDLPPARGQPAVQYHQFHNHGQPTPQPSSPAVYGPAFMPYQQAQLYSPMQVPTPQSSSPVIFAHNPTLAGLNLVQQQQLLGMPQQFFQLQHQRQIQPQNVGHNYPQNYGSFSSMQYGQPMPQQAVQGHPSPYMAMPPQRQLPQMVVVPGHRHSHPAAMLAYNTPVQKPPVPFNVRQSAVPADNLAATMTDLHQQPGNGNAQHAGEPGYAADNTLRERADEHNQSRTFQDDVALFLTAHSGAMAGWDRLCKAMNNRQLNTEQFYFNGFGILYRVGATALMKRFRAFKPKEWSEQYVNLVEQHVITQIKNKDQAQSTRKHTAEDARVDGPLDGRRSSSLIVRLSVPRAFLRKLDAIDGDAGNDDHAGTPDADEGDHTSMTSSPRPVNAKPKKKVPARGYRANVGDVGSASQSPAQLKVKSSQMSEEGENDDEDVDADNDSSPLSSLTSNPSAASTPPKRKRKSSASGTAKNGGKNRQRHPGLSKFTSAEVEHFGPVFDNRRAILARSDRPYIHFACGQGFTHPDDVRAHHLGRGYGRCEALTDQHEGKEWDEHESCKVTYPAISYTRLKDGFVILEKESWDTIQACIAAGRKLNKRMEMEGSKGDGEASADAEDGGKVAGKRKGGKKASVKEGSQSGSGGRKADVDESNENFGSGDADHESIDGDPFSEGESTAARGKRKVSAKKTVPKKRRAADGPSKDETKKPTVKRQKAKGAKGDKRNVPSRQEVVKAGAD